jgi:hypothetical protein
MRVFWAALVIAVAVPGVASADVRVPLPRALKFATYGAGQVVYAAQREGGPIHIAAGPRSGALATLSGFSEDAYVSLAANASGYLVAVRDGEREFVALGGYDGSLRPLVDCRAGGDLPGAELTMAAGTGGFAVAGARCGTPAAVDLVGPDGAITPLPDLAIDVENLALAYAEPFLVVTIDADSDAGTVRVLNLADGGHRDFPAGYAGASAFTAVLAAGELVVGPGDDVGRRRSSGLYAWAPGAPAPRLLTKNADSFEPVFAAPSGVLFTPAEPVGGRLALALAPLDGGAIRSVGAPGIGAPRQAIALDGTTAVIGSWACDGTLQATILQTPTPEGTYGCPMTLTGGSAATLSFTCRNGCRTSLEVRQRGTRRHPCETHPTSGEIPSQVPVCETLGTATLRRSPSARPVRVPLRLTSAGRDARRRHARLAVTLAMDDQRHPGPEFVGTTDRNLQF